MVTQKLCKEYLNAVTCNIAYQSYPRMKHWTVWYMERFYVSTLNKYGSCRLRKQSVLAHPDRSTNIGYVEMCSRWAINVHIDTLTARHQSQHILLAGQRQLKALAYAMDTFETVSCWRKLFVKNGWYWNALQSQTTNSDTNNWLSVFTLADSSVGSLLE